MMKHKTINKFLKSLFVISLSGLLFGISQSANASGFAIAEQSASGMGNAFAGGAASANDASTVWYNPAGMTRLNKNSSAVAAIHSITPSIEFKDNGSTDFLGGAQTGGDGGDAGHSAVVPNIYYTMSLDDGITFGLGINGPFGLSTEYDRDWKGRYFGVESAVKVININPALAFKVDDALSLGVGLNFQQMDVVLSKAINSAAICGGLFLAGFPGLAACAGAPDGFAEIDGTSTSWGANLGLMYEFSEATRLGFAYRSTVRHSIKGDADFDTPGATQLQTDPLLVGTFGTGFFNDTDASSDLNLPASASLSFYHDLMSNLALMADLTWTEWSKLDEVRIEYQDGAQGTTVEEFGWTNTLRYSVGATYRPMPALAIRAGVALDEAPVDDKNKRGVRLPDNDRLWFSLGAGYEVMPGLELDVSYALLTIDDAEIDISDQTGGNLKGDYEESTNILSAQANWKF